ncbi:hypothetical protein RB195_021509 [Necator americanus]|uniref:Uncharacterized protein n=1 Tax=Necator americanus TaxID=51031 RepID=A0ABR1EC30_NECAM
MTDKDLNPLENSRILNVAFPSTSDSENCEMVALNGNIKKDVSENEDENCPAPMDSLVQFTQDPMEIQPSSEHSQIPTPENASDKRSFSTESNSSDKETTNDGNLKKFSKMADVFNLIPSDIKSILYDERSTPFDHGNPRTFRRNVSIASPEKTIERLRGSNMDQRSPPLYDSDAGYSERTPLLGPCRSVSSLPSVVGYDSTRSVFDFPGPSTARSEVGRDELRRKRRRIRRYSQQRIMATQKMRGKKEEEEEEEEVELARSSSVSVIVRVFRSMVCQRRSNQCLLRSWLVNRHNPVANP